MGLAEQHTLGSTGIYKETGSFMVLSSSEISQALHEKCMLLRESGAAEAWLERLVAAPTQSQIAGQGHILRSYLSETIEPLLSEIGFEQGIFGNPLEGEPPFLVAKRHEASGLPTILVYGHGM